MFRRSPANKSPRAVQRLKDERSISGPGAEDSDNETDELSLSKFLTRKKENFNAKAKVKLKKSQCKALADSTNSQQQATIRNLGSFKDDTQCVSTNPITNYFDTHGKRNDGERAASSDENSPESKEEMLSLRKRLRDLGTKANRKRFRYDTFYNSDALKEVIAINGQEDENVDEKNVDGDESSASNDSEKSSKKSVNEGKETELEEGTIEGYSLPVLIYPSTITAGFQCISGKLLANLSRSMDFEQFQSRYILVDCRFPYEYQGGHIKGAINIFKFDCLENLFFSNNTARMDRMRNKIPIFYCEFSQYRGPLFATFVRQCDRIRNVENYPNIHYKELYLLDGGYKKFYKQPFNRDLCTPSGYTSMFDEQYKEDRMAYVRYLRNTAKFGPFETPSIMCPIRRSISNPAMYQENLSRIRQLNSESLDWIRAFEESVIQRGGLMNDGPETPKSRFKKNKK